MGGAWQGVSVLVTGAGGFIASHLVDALVEQGARVRAFVRYNSRGDPGLLSLLPVETLDKLQITAGDLRDPHAVHQALQGVTHVYHLGALIAIPYSYHHPREVVESNVLGTLNVLMAARQAGVERLVHTSTSEVYGTALRVPIDESHPLQGQSPYSASKIAADKLAESFYRSYDLPVVTLRPFNTYGPRQSARAVIPTIISQALTSDVIYLGNLAASRDLTFVADTVAGFLLAGTIPAIEGQTFNLGSGEEITIEHLARQVIDLIQRQVEIRVDPQRLRPEKSEVQRLVADYRQAATHLGWAPRTQLRQGLERTIVWIADHLERYQPGSYQL